MGHKHRTEAKSDNVYVNLLVKVSAAGLVTTPVRECYGTKCVIHEAVGTGAAEGPSKRLGLFVLFLYRT